MARLGPPATGDAALYVAGTTITKIVKTSISILIAEDDGPILSELAEGFRIAGYEVTTASDGKEAWLHLLAREFDVVLTDIQMPCLNGLELFKRLRELYDIPVVFLTASDDSGRVAEAMNLGAVSYLVKPVAVKQLLPVIAFALNQHAAARLLRQKTTHLEAALRQTQDLSIAIGMLRERLKLSQAEAFELLRSKARRERRKVHEVARELTAE